VTAAPATADRVAGPGVAAPRLRADRIVRAEWVKLRTLRSSAIVAAVTVLVIAGLGVVFCATTAARWPHESLVSRLAFDPTRTSLGGIYLAQLVVGVFGAVAVTSEYVTGTIRTTFSVVPARVPVLAAKVLVIAVGTLVVTLPSALAAFFAGQRLLSERHIQTTFAAPHVARAVVGSALYLTAIAVFGVALGWLLRGTASAVSALFALLLIVPVIVHFLPTGWSDAISPWLPSNAGGDVFAVGTPSGPLTAWTGYGVLLAEVAATVTAAVVLLPRRDV
jgi:ABC-2 type transport system permease protein